MSIGSILYAAPYPWERQGRRREGRGDEAAQERGGSYGSRRGGSLIQRPRRDVVDCGGRPSRSCLMVPVAATVTGCSLGVEGAAMTEGEEESVRRRPTPCRREEGLTCWRGALISHGR
jgi:hypothetical protein